jgi:hypothetical protein
MEFLNHSIELFHKGGPVMYLLAICSLFVVAIADVFILRGDKQVPYGQVIAVLDEIKLAGAHRISVAAEKAR